MVNVMIGRIISEEDMEEVSGQPEPTVSSTVLMVAKEKKKMEARGDMPERRKDNAPPIVSRSSPSSGWLYRAPNAYGTTSL